MTKTGEVILINYVALVMNSRELDADFHSVNCYGESLCGDSFLREDNRGHILMVASDGLGHGNRANTLSEMTCEIVMSEWNGVESLDDLMHSISRRLPICPVRGVAYATFTLIDYCRSSGVATIVEYDSPSTLLFRGAEPLTAQWDMASAQGRDFMVTELEMKRGDRIVVVSDGVTQSGLGRDKTPRGWGSVALSNFVGDIISHRGVEGLSSGELSARVVERALENDMYYPKDDISCCVVKF